MFGEDLTFKNINLICPAYVLKFFKRLKIVSVKQWCSASVSTDNNRIFRLQQSAAASLHFSYSLKKKQIGELFIRTIKVELYTYVFGTEKVESVASNAVSAISRSRINGD